MFMIFLKYFNQILLVVVGIMSQWWETHTTTPGGKKRPTFAGSMTIIGFLVGFAVFIGTDVKERNDKAEQEAKQRREIDYLKQLYFNQYLAEVEISFKPSAEHWSRIVEAYKSTNQINNMTVSYMDTPMVAERASGGGYWKIRFDPIEHPEGSTGLNPVSTNEPRGKGFENVLREAMIGLTIEWGNGVKTVLQPITDDNYPSVIAVSQDRLAYRLRPPLMILRLSSLSQDPTITLRARENYPDNIRFHSLDPLAEFDETFPLSWTKAEGGVFEDRVLPYISAPHRLNVKFKTDRG